MVTEVITRQTSPVLAVAEQLGIPVQIRPWWGSVRRTHNRLCGKCGRRLYELDWCSECRHWVQPSEVKTVKVPEEWLCPGGYAYSVLHWPEVEDGKVVMWEGLCNYQNHHHKQTLTVIDQDETAFLLEVRASCNHTRFIIGMDDGHPYVAPVNRRPATVQDAFDWLVPNRVREALTLGKDVKRQGDWFFVPYDKEPRIYKGKPTKDDELWRSRPVVYRNYLNHNAFLHYGSQTRHKGELVVYKQLLGAPYPLPIVKGKVRAPDHPTLVLDTWHIGIRNRSTPAGNRDGRNED